MFQKILVLGFGNMSSAIVKNMLHEGAVNLNSLFVVSHGGKSTENMKELGLNEFESQKGFDAVLLGLKPQNFHEILPEYVGCLENDATIISMMAGVQSQKILDCVGSGKYSVVRIMPNTPCAIGEGVVASYLPESWSKLKRDDFEAMFQCCGEYFEAKSESDLHVITAIAGSGPAMFFYVMEAMIKQAESCGFGFSDSQRLVASTCKGAGAYALSALGEMSVEQLKLAVISKGGTTEAGLKVLESFSVAESIEKAIDGSVKRSIELS